MHRSIVNPGSCYETQGCYTVIAPVPNRLYPPFMNLRKFNTMREYIVPRTPPVPICHLQTAYKQFNKLGLPDIIAFGQN